MNEAIPDLQLEIQYGLALLAFDRPDSKVNLLTRRVMLRLDELLETIEAAVERGQVQALLIRSGKHRNFIAGADIDELAAIESAAEAAEMSRRGQEIFLRLERLPVPTVAAIDGACVGGGLELALACDFRVASDHPRTRLRFPETQIGILPGLGGTVRTPRLIGLRHALDLILSGRQVSARRASKLGLIDQIFEADRFDKEAGAFTKRMAGKGKKPLRRRRSFFARAVQDGAPARWLITRLTRKAVAARTKGHYPALPAALDVTVSGLTMSPEKAYAQESETFGALSVTPECKNLIAIYQLTETARKSVPAGEPAKVKRAGVVGAGLMGAGIAELFAYQNIPVRVVDLDRARVDAGVARAKGLLEKAADRSGWSADELKERRDCLRGATSYEGFERANVVVEAVLELMDVKRRVFRTIEENVPETSLIVSNTSALSISELQREMSHPGRSCGLHFFNPPHRMPLVEVVRGEQTADDSLATAFELAVHLGKTPIVVKDSPGFVVNRILAAYLTEAGYLLQGGMSIERLDRTMSQFGMPVGPLRLLDEIGFDVVAEVSQTMVTGLGERFAPAPVMGEVLASGVTGRKGGLGFYRYDGKRAKGVNPEVEELLRREATGTPPGSAAAEERMVFSMINEAARILDDAVVDSPGTLDVAMIMGTGFPPFRGGLLRYADSLGLDRVRERLRHYAADAGPRLEPAPNLENRKAFYD
ncbi:MAG: fatty oxidation complex subunit alpha [Gemmatimonadetes bacterium]|nr:fatty oxidation complex subunit alpha [Gemmatimonadota bacterium]NIO31266.1 fatty oxidation complex subunit alpha [Gemmatimonadota bacterium]